MDLKASCRSLYLTRSREGFQGGSQSGDMKLLMGKPTVEQGQGIENTEKSRGQIMRGLRLSCLHGRQRQSLKVLGKGVAWSGLHFREALRATKRKLVKGGEVGTS